MSQIFTGARGVLKIDNKIVGFVGGVNVTAEFTLTDVDVIGQLEVGDLAETGFKCNFSVNVFKEIDKDASDETPTFANSAGALGFDTSSQSAGVSPMRKQSYFNVELYDEETEQTVYYMEDCKYESGTGQMDARGLWQGTWNFRCRKGYEVGPVAAA